MVTFIYEIILGLPFLFLSFSSHYDFRNRNETGSKYVVISYFLMDLTVCLVHICHVLDTWSRETIRLISLQRKKIFRLGLVYTSNRVILQGNECRKINFVQVPSLE